MYPLHPPLPLQLHHLGTGSCIRHVPAGDVAVECVHHTHISKFKRRTTNPPRLLVGPPCSRTLPCRSLCRCSLSDPPRRPVLLPVRRGLGSNLRHLLVRPYPVELLQFPGYLALLGEPLSMSRVVRFSSSRRWPRSSLVFAPMPRLLFIALCTRRHRLDHLRHARWILHGLSRDRCVFAHTEHLKYP